MALVAKPDALSSIPRIHTTEGESKYLQPSSTSRGRWGKNKHSKQLSKTQIKISLAYIRTLTFHPNFYNLDLECSLNTHTLKTWSLTWYHWRVVGTFKKKGFSDQWDGPGSRSSLHTSSTTWVWFLETTVKEENWAQKATHLHGACACMSLSHVLKRRKGSGEVLTIWGTPSKRTVKCQFLLVLLPGSRMHTSFPCATSPRPKSNKLTDVVQKPTQLWVK